MVSFLGLRFGSDRKKLQNKQKEAEKSAKKWKKGDKESFGSDESFGHNFSRPQRPPSRPGTAGSFRNTMLFKSPFANSEATSSMVDLAPPSARRPSAGSLRQAASSSNLRNGKLKISAPIGPPQTLPMEGGPNSPLTPSPITPGTPSRPGTAGSMKKDWAMPLDIPYAKEANATRPHTSAGPTSGKSPLGQFEFDIGPPTIRDSTGRKSSVGVLPNGYPSPPPSVKSDEQSLTRVSTEPKLSGSAKPAPSSLRRVNTAEQTRLPSPAASEESKAAEGPVIRNVIAKRETMTFHSPRRRSFSKQVDEQTTKREIKARTEEEKAEIKKRRQTEGFEGNFSAFNFGGPVVDTSVPLPTERAISPLSSEMESPMEGRPERKSARERGMSEAMTNETVSEQSKDEIDNRSTMASSIDIIPRPLTQDLRKPAPSTSNSHTPSLTPSVDSFTKYMRPRVDSDTRCPGTPTALRAPPPVGDRPSIRSQSSHDSQWSFKLDQAPPSKLNVDKPPEIPLRANPPSEAPKEAEAPVRPKRPDSPESRRGRSPERFDHAPPPTLNPDRRSQSPLRARQPSQGLFPKSKGLPRGRQPGAGAPPIQPVSLYGDAAPPRPPRENEGLTANPEWAERAEKHLSAIPAPLTPSMTSSFNDDDLHPWAVKNNGPPSLAPPRLPSPTFSSLEESLSENILKTFEPSPSPEPNHGKPLISPVLSEFGVRGDSPMRVEAKKAPPRPSPITLPPSHGGTPNGSMKSPATGEFSPGFI